MGTRAIILCAGGGTRLGAGMPKPLLQFSTGAGTNQTTILERQIRALRRLDEYMPITIVLGYKHQEFAPYIQKYRLNTTYNPLWKYTGTYFSLMLAMANNTLDDEVLILNGDTIFHPDLLHHMDRPGNYAAVKSLPQPTMEEVVAIVQPGNAISAIGKNIHSVPWGIQPPIHHGDRIMESFGVYKFTPALAMDLLDAADKINYQVQFYETGLNIALKKEHFLLAIREENAIEIDTPGDLVEAKKLWEMISL